MTGPISSVTVDRLAQCPKCKACCFAVMWSPWAGLRLARHGDQRHPCYGPTADDLVDLLLDQYGLRVGAP